MMQSLQRQELALLKQQRNLEDKQTALTLSTEKGLRDERAAVEAKSIQKP
jgi:hypothetical protein